jgi:metallo-beta-lactamase class B
MIRGSLRVFALATVSAAVVLAQGQAEMNKPFEPHKIIGNVYYVGTAALASFLITTPEGHILLNSDFESTVPLLRANVERLGFKFNEIKIVLQSHAHADHVEGDALVKEFSGARVMAMEQDIALARRIKPGGKEHPIDRVLKDGETVTLGGSTMVAHLTPGHTPGCTTWSMKVQDGERAYDVVVLCSLGNLSTRSPMVLVNNKAYPQIADDFVRSFKTLRSMPCDVFLASHGQIYHLAEKHAKLTPHGPNPFIDAAGFKAHLDVQERNFKERLAEQQKLR